MCFRFLFKKENNSIKNDIDTGNLPQQDENNEIETETIEQNEPTEPMEDYSKLMVHLDNGHAKSTPGKRSPGALVNKGYGDYTAEDLSLYEYEYNRIIVNEVNEKLKNLGFKTYIVTPETDKDISLTTRANRSNVMATSHPEIKHIFISAHVNAAGDGKTWYTGNNASYWSAWTSRGQTAGDKLADCFYEAAEEILPKYGKKISKDMTDGDKDMESDFTVLVKTNSPAVLIESLFMTNVDDVLFLKSEKGKNAIVDIYVNAIKKYYEKHVK